MPPATTLSPAQAEPLASPHRHDEPEAVLQRLAGIDILRALPAEEIQALVPTVEHILYPAATRFITEGEGGDALYFIESGNVRVERAGAAQTWEVGPGSAVGETALLTGEPRSASVTALTDLSVWRIDKASFDRLVASSPNLRAALERLIADRRQGVARELPSANFWTATALRAMDARKALHGWQLWMGVGLLSWALLTFGGLGDAPWFEGREGMVAAVELVAGLLILQGACEAFITGVERLGARRGWEGFISGTVGSVLSTLPEFVVIAFLVRVEPLAAVVTAVVTIFNNALAFSIYSFFLPKDRHGVFAMPRSLTTAGGEILIAGGGVALIVGLVMMVLNVSRARGELAGFDLIAIGAVLIGIYVWYLQSLLTYYGEGKDDEESVPPDPGRLGHHTGWLAIGGMFFLGVLGSYAGGESIGSFAEAALTSLGLPTIPTAAALAFFAGISEYIIVWKSHRRGELGIALSNVFGGISQVMFLLLPCAMLLIGVLGLANPGGPYVLPIVPATLLLFLLLFPLFYVLHQLVQQEKALSSLGGAAMTGIYLLLLYFLFTSPT